MKDRSKRSEKPADVTQEKHEGSAKSRSLLLVKIDEYRERKALKEADNDVIFSEKLGVNPYEEETALPPLRRGNIDTWFMFWALLLICFGAVMSFSASAVYAEQRYGSATHFLWRYLLFSALAIIITVPFILFARPWHWRIFGAGAYVVSVLLLIVVLFVGGGDGVQRWIAIGPITIQPSEIAKTAVIMVLALYMSKYERQITSTHKFGGNFRHGVLMPMVIIGTICVLIALEKHISGLMIVGIVGVIVMYLGGTRLRWLFMFLGIIAAAGIFLIAVSSYAQDRVNIWLHLDQVDPLGQAWQTLQGLYAIGSGGFFGVGIGGSRQKFGYVSQPQNDFIFTIVCEELGFIGAFALVLVFGLLIWRGIQIGRHAPDKFCALTVWGLTFKIALQVAMNIAVVTNSMPNTGIALPFFSSGGTALMLQIFEVGIILSISRFSAQKQ